MASSFRRDAVSRIAPAVRAPLSKGDIPHVFSSWKKKSVKQNTAPVRYPSLCQTKNNLMYTPLNHEKLVASWQTSCVYFRLQILYIQGFGIPTPDLYITRYLLPATTSCSHPRWFAVLSMLKFTPWKFDSLNLQKNSISKFGISLANC